MARTKLREHDTIAGRLAEDASERDSGIQLIVPRIPSLGEVRITTRPIERPTVYMRAVRFDASGRRISAANEQTREAHARATLRVRLTPYAREHAVADGETDDTPASFLRHFASIGSINRVPYRCAPDALGSGFEFDDRELRLLSLIDGASDLETVLDGCRMPAHCALRILCDLSERGIIAFR